MRKSSHILNFIDSITFAKNILHIVTEMCLFLRVLSRGCAVDRSGAAPGPGGPPQPAQQSKRLQQTQAQVDEVLTLWPTDVCKYNYAPPCK